MNRADLEEAVLAACKRMDEPMIVVFGSQSILGSYDETMLPEETTRSIEVDMSPYSAFTTGGGVEEKLSLLDVWVGEESDFHTIHGIYVEGIHKGTVVLPYGWDNRLVHFNVAGTEVGQYGRTALCLDTIDLCVSKTRSFVGHEPAVAECVTLGIIWQAIHGIIWHGALDKHGRP